MAISRSTRARRWLSGVALLALATLLTATPAASQAQPVPSCAPDAAGFDDLVEGTEYGVGDTFASGGATLVGRPFTYSDGGTAQQGFARVDPPLSMAGGTGLELQVNNILLGIGFGGPLETVELAFGEFGGNVNLEINGDLRNVGDLSELSGTTVGGVAVTVASVSEEAETWRLRADGPIRTFAIGGQELWIDDVVGVPVCPDLAIDDASHRFTELGRRLEVTVAVRNLGEVASGATAVSVAADGWPTAREPVASLDPGAGQETTLALTVPPGQHGRRVSFVVRVDPDDAIRETDERNNVETLRDVLVPAADLAVAVASWEVPGDRLIVDVVVRNQGAVSSRPTTVVTVAEGWQSADAVLGRLRPGDESTLRLEVPVPAEQRGRAVNMAVVVDPDDVVRRELDETNNTQLLTVDVPPSGQSAGDTAARDLWPLLLVAVGSIAALVAWWAVRRMIRRRRPRLPELARLHLDLRAGLPDVRVSARPDGAPRHNVRVILRADRPQVRVRERTLR